MRVPRKLAAIKAIEYRDVIYEVGKKEVAGYFRIGVFSVFRSFSFYRPFASNASITEP